MGVIATALQTALAGKVVDSMFQVPVFDKGRWVQQPYEPVGKRTALGNTPADLGVGAFTEARSFSTLRAEVLPQTPLVPNAQVEQQYNDAPPPAGGLAPVEAQSGAALGMGTVAAPEGGQSPVKREVAIIAAPQSSGFLSSFSNMDTMQLALFGLLGVGLIAAVRS